MQLNLSHITYAYPGGAAHVLQDASAVFPQGWTGIVGDNGCGKTTLMRIAAGLIQPDAGTVSPQLFAAYCSQDATDAPADLFGLADDWSQEGRRVRELLRIEDEWFWRYETLSGGQQRRIQIACALWRRPDVLVLDEPTNDLDAQTRTLLMEALATFPGIGMLVSHDRDLLDRLASRCLMFENGAVRMRPGGYTEASRQAANARNAALKERSTAKRELARLEVEAKRRREEASRQQGKRSRRGLDKKDSDGRGRIGLAIVSGKDGVAAKLSTTMDRRVARVRADLDAMPVAKRYDAHLDGGGTVARSHTVAHLAEGMLSAGDFSIHVPEVWVGARDHVVLSGNNGTGKSLILHHVRASVPESVQVAFIPQEVSAPARMRALAALAKADAASRGRILSLVARLNSDPARVLDGDDLSPGELRKLLLAEQLLCEPSFLILDEPTNHLDVGSLEALQEMLVGFPGAVLLVSHDAALADAVAHIRWQTVFEGDVWRLRVL